MKNILKDTSQDLPVADTHSAANIAQLSSNAALQQNAIKAAEKGGPKGLEPTRYGDWEKKGKCVDF